MLATIMKRFIHIDMKRNILVIAFFISINCMGQVTVIQGNMIELDSLNPVSLCRIIINDSIEYLSDNNGQFNMNINVKIEKIEFVAIGYYRLTLIEIPNMDTLKFDTIALSTIRIGDDHFITIKENGKRDRKADRKRKKKTKNEMIRQASQAYIIYEKKKINAQSGLIIIKNCS